MSTQPSEDISSVQKIYQELKRVGHEPWMDKLDIFAGEVWEVAIKRAMKNADLVMLCLSSTAVKKRGYQRKEFRMALGLAEEKFDSDIYIIPLRLDDCEVPDELTKYQWQDMFTEGAWDRLMAAIEESQKRMAS